MKRIVVIGITGSGKTVFAKKLEAALNIEHTELDELFWKENWEAVEREEFRNKVNALTDADSWILCGNYSRVRDIVWSKADTIIWLDYSFGLTFYRLFKRTIQRAFTNEKLWGKVEESFTQQFFSKDSLFLHFFKSYFKTRKSYKEEFRKNTYNVSNLIRLKRPKEAKRFIARL